MFFDARRPAYTRTEAGLFDQRWIGGWSVVETLELEIPSGPIS
jgi:hypothetical protein